MVVTGGQLRDADVCQTTQDGGCGCGFEFFESGVKPQPQLALLAVADAGHFSVDVEKHSEIKPTVARFDGPIGEDEGRCSNAFLTGTQGKTSKTKLTLFIGAKGPGLVCVGDGDRVVGTAGDGLHTDGVEGGDACGMWTFLLRVEWDVSHLTLAALSTREDVAGFVEHGGVEGSGGDVGNAEVALVVEGVEGGGEWNLWRGGGDPAGTGSVPTPCEDEVIVGGGGGGWGEGGSGMGSGASSGR